MKSTDRHKIWVVSNRVASALLLFATIASIVTAQLDPPAWFNHDSASGPFENHPALSGVEARFRSTIRDECTSVRHGKFGRDFIEYHPLHGDLLFFEGNQLLRVIPTGLQYVFAVQSIRDVSPPYSLRGVAATGVLANGASRVAYAAWTESSDLAQVTFSPLLPDSPIGERFIIGNVVDDRAYVLRGVAADVLRYIDTDADGLPDAPAPLTPLSLTTSTAPRGFKGVYRRDGEDRVLCYQRSLRRRRFYHLVDDAGQLRFVKSDPNVAYPVTPYLRGHQPIAGLRSVRLRHRRGEVVEVVCDGRVLAKVLVDSATGVVTVPLSRPLQVGKPFILRSGAVTSSVVTVLPAKPVLFQGEPYRVAPGQAVILDGGNFGYSDLEVHVDVDETGFVPAQFKPSEKLRQLVIDLPPAPTPSGVRRVTIRLQRSSNPDDTRQVKKVLIVP